MTITHSISTNGGYDEDGPNHNTAVDYNPRYGEEVANWEGGVVTTITMTEISHQNVSLQYFSHYEVEAEDENTYYQKVWKVDKGQSG